MVFPVAQSFPKMQTSAVRKQCWVSSQNPFSKLRTLAHRSSSEWKYRQLATEVCSRSALFSAPTTHVQPAQMERRPAPHEIKVRGWVGDTDALCLCCLNHSLKLNGMDFDDVKRNEHETREIWTTYVHAYDWRPCTNM